MRGGEHYDTLGVPADADGEAIKAAYRKLAMRWHPDKNPDDVAEAESMFKKVSLAYQILGDPQKRAAYDKDCEKQPTMPPAYPDIATKMRSRSRSPLSESHKAAEPRKQRSSHITVVNLVARKNMEDRNDTWSASFKELFGLRRRRTTKEEPIVVPLKCTLEELYIGCTKRIKLLRERIVASGSRKERLQTVSEIIPITVKPGWKAGTRITFECRGNESPDTIPADIVFVITDIPHEVYKRDGDDLTTTINISAFYALAGYSMQLTTLDGRTLERLVHPAFHVSQVVVIPGEGMPTQDGAGDLRVNFEYSVLHSLFWIGTVLLFFIFSLMAALSFVLRDLLDVWSSVLSVTGVAAEMLWAK